MIGPDGTVYVGNTDGILRAFTPAGDLRWMRDTPHRRIGASPVVGRDGSIYVVGLFSAIDHRDGEPHIRNDATMYRFDANGAMVWAMPFPEWGPLHWGSGTTTASPNIWRSDSDEVVMVPHLYPTYGGHEIHLVAFSTAGSVLFDHEVTNVRDEITAEVDWTVFIPSFNRWFGIDPTVLYPAPNELADDLTLGMPPVGMYSSGGGEPVVVVADTYENLVGYAFSLADGFREMFRKHLAREPIHMSAPVLLGDAHSAIVGQSTDKAWLLSGGPSVVDWPALPIPFSGAGLSVGGSGVFSVTRAGGLASITTYPDRQVIRETRLQAESIAPASTSRSHVFVSTVTALVTLDAAGANVTAEYLWEGGGLSTPAIGPDGRVYALAGDTLFSFTGPTDPFGPADGLDVHDRITFG